MKISVDYRLGARYKVIIVGSLLLGSPMGEGCLRIARDSKGRLSTNEITVSIKIRLEESTADQLRDMAEQLDVPMASIIRQGIIKALEELSKDVVS